MFLFKNISRLNIINEDKITKTEPIKVLDVGISSQIKYPNIMAKTKAKYWSCKMWSKKSVTKVTKGSEEEVEKALLDWLDESLSKDSNLTEKQKKLPTPGKS